MSDRLERVEIRSAAALEDWLAAEHGRGEGVWLVTLKKGRPGYLSREAVLDALIAWGWTDGRRKAVDSERTMQLISPRRQQAWAQSYKDRAARLEAEGRMRDPGRAAIAAAKAAGLWHAMAAVDALTVPDDLAAALGPSGERFAAMAPSYRRNVLRWIEGAKRAETRARRVAEVASRTHRGERVPQY